MSSSLHPSEAEVFARVRLLLREGERVLDAGPARADLVPEGGAKGPGVLVVTDQRLLFGGMSGTAIPMGWANVAKLERKNKLAGATLTLRMERGATARFYLGKVFSAQIARHWEAVLQPWLLTRDGSPEATSS